MGENTLGGIEVEVEVEVVIDVVIPSARVVGSRRMWRGLTRSWRRDGVMM